ncbi:hypothetical protein [Ralstonia sp. UBA689]|uniref:hypothetical protein n=1 Tax=Ralstonia sp. UBA689 TaxID=1947373 RepID=UPI0025FBF05C|nr:hypothetical protein [Ralstonia sp. UBA689]
MFVVGVLSGCAAMSPPPSPQQQLVNVQKSDRASYEKSLNAYVALAANSKASNRTRVLEAYQALLYQYSIAAGSWVRAIDPLARQTLPPALQPFPIPSGTPTLADVNRDYERALAMNATMWDINGAATGSKPPNPSVPIYTGAVLFMPSAPPLPPLQDTRDPKYARLVAMTAKVDAAQKADIAQQRAAIEKQYAEQAEWRARHPIGHYYDSINPATGRPYPAPQQPEQRWCLQTGIGGTGRVPC